MSIPAILWNEVRQFIIDYKAHQQADNDKYGTDYRKECSKPPKKNHNHSDKEM